MNRIFKSFITLILIFSFSSVAYAHDHGGYSHDSTMEYLNPDWMRSIRDDIRLNELSIPGTHDTMSNGYGGDIAQTQSLTLQNQLSAGIRFLDIRCRYTEGSFAIHHGPIFLHTMFGDVLDTATKFLENHPNEVILMRVKQEHSEVSDDLFNQTLRKYMDRYPGYFFDSQNRTNTNPTLKEMRGKIVLMMNAGGSNIGLNYPHDFNIQDDYHLSTNWDLYDKWSKVKKQLNEANTSYNRGSKIKFINYLSGSGGSFPYFVASGHSSPGTSAPRLATGLTTPGWSNSYPDFPRVACFIGICTIAFEGTNILTTDYIENNNLKYTGIIVADFPGQALINNVIKTNNHLLKSDRVTNGIYKIIPGINDSAVIDFSVLDQNVVLWKDHDGENQKWEFEYDEKKRAYQIKSTLYPNIVLAWNNYKGSTNVFGTLNQQKEEHYWILDKVSDGYYIIKNNLDPDLVLDVDGANPNNGTNIKVNRQHDLNSVYIPAQKFKLNKIS
ncbi:phosphatidylinositol-specific phospholipase C domain-containing protein [Bacillus cereus]|uniref:phosphatidylinositol-specific phospholipase C domain-containing protein n=3 Tax=Bacillus cereus group TaxID=86661 RepID=UPI000279EEE8|nr:phosphatidylinositol-specific phospholipase C domain-containing protein [Bacillus cereus]EJR28524.1 hypothetical protein IIE_05363 [Bacillus cereus VD045]